jgi:hypothetical protein
MNSTAELDPVPTFTAFDGDRRIAGGTLLHVALEVKAVVGDDLGRPVLVFDDRNGRPLDLDLHGSGDDVRARYDAAALPTMLAQRGRGRPRLGVVAREVTLLPRHWEWLGSQPGGASAALRRIVDDARKQAGPKDRTRRAHEAAYHFLLNVAGDRPGYEEATRALFAGDRVAFEACMSVWPSDITTYALALAFPSESDAE